MSVAWALNVWANDSWVGMNGGPPNAWRGADTPPPPPVIVEKPSGVRKSKPRKINLRELENREDLGKFLRSQLTLRQHIPFDAPVEASKPVRKKDTEKQRALLKARAAEELRATEQRILEENNERIKLLLLGGK
jgi:hypothetical protein